MGEVLPPPPPTPNIACEYSLWLPPPSYHISERPLCYTLYARSRGLKLYITTAFWYVNPTQYKNQVIKWNDHVTLRMCFLSHHYPQTADGIKWQEICFIRFDSFCHYCTGKLCDLVIDFIKYSTITLYPVYRQSCFLLAAKILHVE